MAAYDYAFTLTPGNRSGIRTFAVACAAVVAVCALSSTMVMSELVQAPAAHATMAPVPPIRTTPARATSAQTATVASARTWAVQDRWWPGEIRQLTRQPPIIPDSELTFTKGYALRLSARQAAPAAGAETNAPVAGVVTSPPTPGPVRAATDIRKATTTVANNARRDPRVDAPADRSGRFDVGNRSLAYDEQRSSLLAQRHGDTFGRLFGRIY